MAVVFSNRPIEPSRSLPQIPNCERSVFAIALEPIKYSARLIIRKIDYFSEWLFYLHLFLKQQNQSLRNNNLSYYKFVFHAKQKKGKR